MSFTRKPAAIAASLALLGGCGGGALLATDASASTGTTSAVASTQGQSGTATVSLTGAKGKTHTRTVPVTCKVVNGNYVVTAVRKANAKAKGKGKGKGAHRAAGLRIRVTGYTGAGSYTGTAAFVRNRGHVTTIRHYKVPVTLTSTGGSFKYSKTLSGKRHAALKGKTISASASWTCSV